VTAAADSAPARRPLRLGVFGAGALGYHHVRLAAASPEVELVGVFDPRPEAARRVADDHGARLFDSAGELAREIEAAVVAVPTVAHAEVAGPLLERGVHVLVEKPMASSLAEADALVAAAARSGAAQSGAVLGVGHVEFYNPAVAALLAAGGRPRFAEAQRLATFTPRSLDVDVVLDLMIHDLQILHALDPSPLLEVRATGIDVLSPKVDIANARLAFASGGVAIVTASRVSAERVRKLRVFLPRRYYSLDYQAQEIRGFRLEEGEERRIVPDDLPVAAAEPLAREHQAFFSRCRGEDVPFVDGAAGRQALATALAVANAIAEPLSTLRR
jgi:predicted dehydrogenase